MDWSLITSIRDLIVAYLTISKLKKELKYKSEEESVHDLGDVELINKANAEQCEKMWHGDCDQDQQLQVPLPLLDLKHSVSGSARLDLTPDMRFKDWESFELHFEMWKVQNWTHTNKRDSRLNKSENMGTHRYLDVFIHCVHYGLPRMKRTKHIRPNQSYMSRGCMFQIHSMQSPRQ